MGSTYAHMIPPTNLLWSSQPSASLLCFAVTSQQFLTYQRCDLKSYPQTNSNSLFCGNPSSRLSQAAFFFFFFGAANLIEMSSESSGCLLPLQKWGADLPRKAAPGSRSNAKQPLPPIAATAPGCRCHLFFCHIHPDTGGGGAASHCRTATLPEWHPGTPRVARLGRPACRQFGHQWKWSASPRVGVRGKGGFKEHFRGNPPWELLSPWEGPKRSGLICLFAFSLLLATPQ